MVRKNKKKYEWSILYYTLKTSTLDYYNIHTYIKTILKIISITIN